MLATIIIALLALSYDIIITCLVFLSQILEYKHFARTLSYLILHLAQYMKYGWYSINGLV